MFFFNYNMFQNNQESDPSPNQEPTNSERKLVCGDWHPSENTENGFHQGKTEKRKKSLGWLVLVVFRLSSLHHCSTTHFHVKCSKNFL